MVSLTGLSQREAERWYRNEKKGTKRSPQALCRWWSRCTGMESVRGMLGVGGGKVLWSAGGHRGPLVIALSAGVWRVEAEVSTCVGQCRFSTYTWGPFCVEIFYSHLFFIHAFHYFFFHLVPCSTFWGATRHKQSLVPTMKATS